MAEQNEQPVMGNDLLFKMLIIGDSGVGKSCLLLRYSDNEYSELCIKTIGVDIRIRRVEMDNKIIKLHMWDTTGQERFKNITHTFYRGAHGVIIVFDLTDLESFNNIKTWLEDINRFGGGHVAKLLVGNKSDLKSKRVVTYEAALEFAKQNEMPYLETSAKTSTNVEQAFMTMTAEMKNMFDTGVYQKPTPTTRLPAGHTKVLSGWCNCC